MTIKFTLTEDAYFKFNLYHCDNSPAQKRTFRTLRFAPAILIVIVSFAVFKDFASIGVAIGFMLAALWILYYPKFHHKNLLKNVQKAMTEENLKEFTGEYSLSFLDDKIQETRHGSTMEIPYRKIEKIEHNDEYLYLYLDSMTAIIVPYSAFKSSEDRQTVLELVKKRQGAKSK